MKTNVIKSLAGTTWRYVLAEVKAGSGENVHFKVYGMEENFEFTTPAPALRQDLGSITNCHRTEDGGVLCQMREKAGVAHVQVIGNKHNRSYGISVDVALAEGLGEFLNGELNPKARVSKEDPAIEAYLQAASKYN